MRVFLAIAIVPIVLVITIATINSSYVNKASQQRVLTEFANDLRVNDVRIVKLTEECILIQRKIAGNARISDKWTNIAISCTGPDK